MNVEAAALILFGGVISVLGIRLIYSALCGFSSRTANDVFPFLLRIDLEELYGTFHPASEQYLQKTLNVEEFRAVQWKRIHLAIHFCDKVSNNATVFLAWARYERAASWDSMSVGVQKNVHELRIACLQCQLSIFAIRSRLRWWLIRMALLPSAAPPSFDSLLAAGSADMLDCYSRATSLAEAFSLAYGEDYHQKFVRAL